MKDSIVHIWIISRILAKLVDLMSRKTSWGYHQQKRYEFQNIWMLGNKLSFLDCRPPSGKTWPGNNVSWFVHLRETWLRNSVSWFVHLRETWLGNNVSWFAHLQKILLGKQCFLSLLGFHLVFKIFAKYTLTQILKHRYVRLEETVIIERKSISQLKTKSPKC
jgi:hypothetical protein